MKKPESLLSQRLWVEPLGSLVVMTGLIDKSSQIIETLYASSAVVNALHTPRISFLPAPARALTDKPWIVDVRSIAACCGVRGGRRSDAYISIQILNEPQVKCKMQVIFRTIKI